MRWRFAQPVPWRSLPRSSCALLRAVLFLTRAVISDEADVRRVEAVDRLCKRGQPAIVATEHLLDRVAHVRQWTLHQRLPQRLQIGSAGKHQLAMSYPQRRGECREGRCMLLVKASEEDRVATDRGKCVRVDAHQT